MMCGIAGKIELKGLNYDSKLKENFEEAYTLLQPRGPDEKGIWYDKTAFFLHTRLKILDLKETASQPMETKDHIICYNGEIYNFIELRNLLKKKGYKFTSSGDTEVILLAWKEWGEKMLDYLDGMFAFSIWDKKNKNLFLARDRFGKKPLIYCINDNGISFASSVSSLSKIENAGSIDREAINSLFRFRYIYEPLTIYDNFKKLPPGSLMKFNKYGPKTYKWYNLKENIKSSHSNNIDKSKIIDLLMDSVEKRLCSDAPVGLFLSGGMDSGIILSALAKMGKKIPCYTISFSEDKSYYDEGDRAEKIAKYFNFDHKKIDLKSKGLINKISEVLEVSDEPFADSSCIPTYIISEYASRDVKVCLSGDGGDEIFGGYRKYLAYRWRKIICLLPLSIREKMSSILSDNKSSYLGELSRKVSRLLRNTSKNLDHMQMNFLDQTSNNEYKLLFGKEKSLLNNNFFSCDFNLDDEINLMLIKDFQFSLLGDMLVKLDRYSMANSLEVRSPLLDKKIVEYAFSLPGKMKVGYFSGKNFLKDSFSSTLPEGYTKFPKRGFEVPLEKWLKGEMRYLIDEATNNKVLDSLHIKDKKVIVKWKMDFLNGKRDHSWKLWTLVSYATWAKRNRII